MGSSEVHEERTAVAPAACSIVHQAVRENCVLECCVNIAILILALVSRGEGSLSASSSLTSFSPIVSSWPISAQIHTVHTVHITEPGRDLPDTPPPTPPGIQLQGFETSQIHPLQSTESSKGIFVQVIALDSRRRKLRLVNIDWETVSPEQTIKIKKDMGDLAYNNVSEHYLRYQLRKDLSKDLSKDYELILWAGHDLPEWILSSNDCRALRDGNEIGVEALGTSVAKTWGYYSCSE